MTLMSLSAFARTHGKSQQAASKWKRDGVLVMKGEKVDAEKSDARMRGFGLGRFGPNAETVVDPLTTDDTTIEARLSAGTLTKVDAEKVKENALALKHLVAVRKEAGSLIEADLVERVVFEEAQKARDAWLNFPSRIAPLLAADLGLDAGLIAEALTAHVHRQLDSLGNAAFDFGGGQG